MMQYAIIKEQVTGINDKGNISIRHFQVGIKPECRLPE